MNGIPDELVENILMRLPVKTLKRLSCVNKWWYNLIHSNSSFISRHYSHHSSCNQNEKLLVQLSIGDCLALGKDATCFLSENDSGDFSNLSIPLLNNYDYLRCNFIGPSINGIICLKIFTLRQQPALDDIALLNVATGEFNKLPRLQFSFPPNFYLDPVIEGLGFGWVPDTNEYKVVIGIDFPHDSIYHLDLIYYHHPSEYYVFTLTTNSWKKLTSEIPFSPSYLNSDPPIYSQICVNGVCYWVHRTTDGMYKIFSFHLRDEVFGILQLPDIIGSDGLCHVSLTLDMLDDSIALIRSRLGVINFQFFTDIWVMDESSWIKKFTIGPVFNICVGLGLVKDELFFEDQSWQLFSININSMQVKDLKLRGAKFNAQVLKYVESLVPIKS